MCSEAVPLIIVLITPGGRLDVACYLQLIHKMVIT